jgi:hypothetical protein
MKYCPDCGLHRLDAEFGKNRSTRDGLAAYCREHAQQRSRDSLARNGGARRYHLRRRYGIEPEQFDALVVRQGGVCAVCEEAEPTHLDHNHATGEIRGALCVPCNNGLGLFRDNPGRLQRAAAYLRGGE